MRFQLPKPSWVLNVTFLRNGPPGRGPAAVLLLLVAGFSLLACSRIPNPFSFFGDGDQIVAAQRDTSPMPFRPSTVLKPIATQEPTKTAPTPTASTAIMPPSFLEVPTAFGFVLTATPVMGETGSQRALSPTRTPQGDSTGVSGGIAGGSSLPASATATATPTAAAEPPTPEVAPTATPTETPEPDESSAGGSGFGSSGGGLTDGATANATSTDTPMPTATREPTKTPKYGAGGGGTVAGGGAPLDTATPTPFGIISPTPTAATVPTETPTPAGSPTATRTPFPTATPIPPGTYDAIVNIFMVPNDLQVETSEKFSVDIVVDPNGQEITVAQTVLGFDPDYLKVTSATHDPDSPLENQLSANDNYDNEAGTVILSSGPFNTSTLPVSTFRLGTITFKSKNSSGQTDIIFLRSGVVVTTAGLSGFNLIDNYDQVTVSITVPPADRPTPTP